MHGVVSVNGNWRMTFTFEGTDAEYHRSGAAVERVPSGTFPCAEWPRCHLARNGPAYKVWLGVERGGEARPWLVARFTASTWTVVPVSKI